MNPIRHVGLKQHEEVNNWTTQALLALLLARRSLVFANRAVRLMLNLFRFSWFQSAQFVVCSGMGWRVGNVYYLRTRNDLKN